MLFYFPQKSGYYKVIKFFIKDTRPAQKPACLGGSLKKRVGNCRYYIIGTPPALPFVHIQALIPSYDTNILHHHNIWPPPGIS